jgi:hypothetical protein
MVANSSLNLTSLDLDSLKNNFVTFLKSQTIFKDYDFSGSNMNVLLDILSYNTYLNSFYLNMIGSEAFLDTAQLRDSVVSIAKELNYIPRSARSAIASVDITFNTSGLTGTLVIPYGTIFTGTNSNGIITFVTDRSYTILSAGSQYNVSNVHLYEGKIFNETFVVDNTIENQKFILSNLNIDDTSINVTVTSSDVTTTFLRAYNLYGVTSNSSIFFVQEDSGSYYEIEFGDGVFGIVPPNASLINVRYRVTKGSVGNGVSKFTLAQNLSLTNGGTISSVINTVSSSSGGANIESVESIKYRAPKSYQVQDRAITASDYMNLITLNFPEVKDVSVFGGEDVFGSVQYGKVFISCSTYSGASLSQSTEQDILNFLANKVSIGTSMSFIEPDYVYIIPYITSYVDFTETSLSPVDISTNIIQKVSDYNTTNLQKFNSRFMLSKFCAQIDDADSSIKGDTTTLSMYKNVLFANGYPQTLTISFNNSIIPGTIESSNFVLSDGNVYKITDFNPINNTFYGSSSNGSFKILNSSNILYFSQVSTNNVQNFINAGLVDYANGSLYIESIDVFNFMNPNGITITATPYSDELYGKNQIVLEIDESKIYTNVTNV